MWQQDMALVEERRKELERDAAQYRKVQELRRQQSHPHNVMESTLAHVGKSLTAITGILRKRPNTANTRLKVRQI